MFTTKAESIETLERERERESKSTRNISYVSSLVYHTQKTYRNKEVSYA